jgi:3-deoxy-D-manno-octulosonic-acid transferase
MASSLFSRPFFYGYRLIWKLAQPLLKRSKRLADGWEERFVPEGWLEPDFPVSEAGNHDDHPVDLWLQAASGGEARLAVSLCRSLRRDVPLRVLIVTWTRQGRDVVENALSALAESHPLLRVAVRFAPFDHPDIVRRAIRQARPRLLALLETELWPGLLAACKDAGVPVRLVNGRINSSTVDFGKFFPKLMADIAPEGIRAISEEDRRAFSTVFPSTSCSVESAASLSVV